jgi:hypothetical protein
MADEHPFSSGGIHEPLQRLIDTIAYPYHACHPADNRDFERPVDQTGNIVGTQDRAIGLRPLALFQENRVICPTTQTARLDIAQHSGDEFGLNAVPEFAAQVRTRFSHIPFGEPFRIVLYGTLAMEKNLTQFVPPNRAASLSPKGRNGRSSRACFDHDGIGRMSSAAARKTSGRIRPMPSCRDSMIY